ncbi:MAG TPA: type VI secretion system baseplate subunit TssK [Vicinamibacterales bacterium]|nr:type VI secretion system baseplate subunit TssK [Vicinamibacterales bacterium]
MKQLSRVVWNEGMHLAQHHFQAQSRYFEDTIQFVLSHLFYAPYGVAGCELDSAALRNGTVSLVHARGAMPDGLPFDIPASDSTPPPLQIGDLFSPTQESHHVLLTIPAYRANGANTQLNGNGGSPDGHVRYVAEPAMLADNTTGRDEKPVSLGRKNFRLALDVESADDVVALPIARVRRSGTGYFVYDAEYIPPCLHVGASPRLLQLLHRLVEILDAKGDSMARGRVGGIGEFAQQEVASFWLLHAIHASLPTLRHCLQAKRVRPEQLYIELARLAGALCTFALESHPRALPAYDHDRLDECFSALDQHIRSHLELITPSGKIAVPLVEEMPTFHMAAITDPRAFGPSRWILGVRSPIDAAQIAQKLPHLVKVCARRFIAELVRRALPGAPLQHLPVPPSAISPRSDWQYFPIGKSGPAWDTVVTTREIGVYIPAAFPEARAELSILLES